MKGKIALLISGLTVVILLAACTSGTGESSSPSVPVKNGYPSHAPGADDVSTMVRGQQFLATPNFFYFASCGRPCWLPLYPTAQLIKGKTVTDNFPYERYLGNAGDALKVVCQNVAGAKLKVSDQLAANYRLTNEHRLGNGSIESSNLWDKVAVPDEALLPRHQPDTTGLEPTPDGQGHYVWGADIWLGNTGDHGIPCK